VRYVVLGAGAIGGAIGGRLAQQGHDVVLIARGAHLAALQSRGLELRDPTGSVVLDLPAVASPAEAKPRSGDVVVLATKSQQTEAALDALRSVAPPGVAVVCAQNGVDNERVALRRFADVYGMRVILAGTHLEAGVVEIATAPVSGILDVGRFPSGVDEVASAVAEDLRAAGFDAEASEAVMEHKYLKLLSNLANAIEAACGTREEPPAAELAAAARREALACYEAAGITVADETRENERRRFRGFPQPVGGLSRAGGSSWQSLERGTGNIEADWLNGEIVLLGRLHGVATPVNERLQAVANALARERRPPGSMTAAELAAGLL
jgi:2-dehydropantoate 2-reductase